MKVTITQFGGVRALTYRYDVNDDMGFTFHLLSEVGQPWQEEAKKLADELAASRGCVIKQVEIAGSPWYADALVEI